MDKYLVKKSKPDTQSDDSNQSTSSEQTNKEKAEDLKHKIVRKFNEDWQNLYFVTEQDGKPFCLLCRDVQPENRKFNIERHFNSKHNDINTKFPLSSDKRAKEINRLKANLQSERSIVKRFLTTNELVSIASYNVAFNLAKSGKPYTDGEFFKDLMCTSVEILCNNMDKKVNENILNNIKMMPLSDNTISRRVNSIGVDIERNLKSDLEKCQCFSLALDESTDICDTAQLVFWVRYTIDMENYHENILAMIPLNEQTRGEDIFNAFKTVHTRFNIDLKKLVSVCSDGAPSMTGKYAGFIARLKRYMVENGVKHELIAYHCIIHQENLCGKTIGNDNNVLQTITKVRSTEISTHSQV